MHTLKFPFQDREINPCMTEIIETRNAFVLSDQVFENR